MTALLASRLAKARADLLENRAAILCGIAMAIAVTPLLMSISDTSTMNTVAAIVGDNLGFYGCIWVVTRRNRFPSGHRRGWRTSVYMFKLYWLSEIIDNMIRASILTWVASFSMASLATTLVGNLLADVVFFGIAALTGEDFSDWCARTIRYLYTLPRRFYMFGYARARRVAALATVCVLTFSTASEPVEHGPAPFTVEDSQRVAQRPHPA